MTRHLVSALLLLLLSLPTLAIAQDDTQTAVELAKDAKGKYDRGDWAGALTLFEAAEAKAHSPVLLLFAARCHRNLGGLLDARRLLSRVADETLDEDAPAPFRNAQAEARSDLDALTARIPTLVIDRTRIPDAWIVSLNGEPVTKLRVEIDPGQHIVRALEEGTNRFEEKIAIAEGETTTVVVGRAASAPPPGSRPDPVLVDDDGNALALVPGLVTLGIGVAGIAVGIGLRVTALNDVAAVKDRCAGNSCLQEDAAVIDDAQTLETVSTVMFIAGGALAATGIVLLIVLPMESDEPAMSLRMGPTYVGLHGHF